MSQRKQCKKKALSVECARAFPPRLFRTRNFLPTPRRFSSFPSSETFRIQIIPSIRYTVSFRAILLALSFPAVNGKCLRRNQSRRFVALRCSLSGLIHTQLSTRHVHETRWVYWTKNKSINANRNDRLNRGIFPYLTLMTTLRK